MEKYLYVWSFRDILVNFIIMGKKDITETGALNILIQVYLSHTSKWYSSVVTTLIGSIGIPLLAFNLQVASPNKLNEIFLHIFSFITVSFLLATLYFLHKVFYSLQFLEELYRCLTITESEKTIIDYRNELMKQMKAYSWIFKSMVKRERKAHKKEYRLHNIFFIASFFLALIGGQIMLSFIWWPLKDAWLFASVWEGILLIFMLIYFLMRII